MPPILQYPNKILDTPCRELSLPFEEDLARHVGEELMAALKETKRKSVGLSANQVGATVRVFVLNVKLLKLKTKSIFVNPELIWESKDKDTRIEECMSLPKWVKVDVERSKSLYLKAFSPSGKLIGVELKGLAARCVLHEIEHLNGGTILSHLSPEKRREVNKALAK